MQPRLHQPEYSLPRRAVAIALAVLLMVAPSWHVCALGGQHCATSASELLCHDEAVLAGHSILTATPVTFDGACLARLLMAMPAGLPAPATLSLPATTQSTLRSFEKPALIAMLRSRPPARSPPIFVI